MLKSLVTPQIVSGVVRHLMGGLGVWMVSNGYADASQVELITGGAATLAAVGWSVAAKF